MTVEVLLEVIFYGGFDYATIPSISKSIFPVYVESCTNIAGADTTITSKNAGRRVSRVSVRVF